MSEQYVHRLDHCKSIFLRLNYNTQSISISYSESSNKCVLSRALKIFTVSEDFTCIGSKLKIIGPATLKLRLPTLRLVGGIESFNV